MNDIVRCGTCGAEIHGVNFAHQCNVRISRSDAHIRWNERGDLQVITFPARAGDRR